MPYEPFGDLHATPEDAVEYSEFYEPFIRLHFSQFPEAQSYFTRAKKVCDLACGSGASAIFIAKHCPQAQIVTVDDRKTIFPELIQQLRGKHSRHEKTSVSSFLESASDTFDVAFLVKAPNVIYPRDCANLARRIHNGGFVLELNDDKQLPGEMSQYFDPVSDISNAVGKSYMTDILWRKK